VPLQDVPHRLATDRVAQMLQGAGNPVIAPAAIFLCHTHHQGLQLLVDLRPTQRLPLPGTIELLRHQPAVPGQNGIRLHDRGHLCQCLLAQALADLSQGLPVPFSQSDATSELPTKDTIFRRQILVVTQEFLIDRPGHICQELLPPHGSCSLHHCLSCYV
jgi:hypothetical protein